MVAPSIVGASREAVRRSGNVRSTEDEPEIRLHMRSAKGELWSATVGVEDNGGTIHRFAENAKVACCAEPVVANPKSPMPFMNGLEAAGQINSLAPDCNADVYDAQLRATPEAPSGCQYQ